MNNNLSNAKIYKIVDNTNNNIYVGSTIKSLEKRLKLHESAYKRYLVGNHEYMTSFDIIKNNNYKIELLEQIDNCISKEQMYLKEKEYIERIKCINKYITGRTREETSKAYYDNNKDKILEIRSKYRLSNSDRINCKFECECGGQYTRKHKSTHFKSLKHINFFEQQK